MPRSQARKRTHIFHIITCSCSSVPRILSSLSSAWKIPNINRVGYIWDESDQRIFEGVGTNCMWVYAGNVTAHSLKRVACLLIKMWSKKNGNKCRFAVGGDWDLFGDQLETKGDWVKESRSRQTYPGQHCWIVSPYGQHEPGIMIAILWWSIECRTSFSTSITVYDSTWIS